MRKHILTILSLICITPLWAQGNADKLLQKTVSKLEKDDGIFMKLDAEIKNDGNTDNIDIELKLSPNGSFYVMMDDNQMWFDGKTIWNGKDYGDGIEEIYITEPTAQEKALYDIIGLLGKHQGYSLSGNGTETFILTASGQERSVEGLSKLTVNVDPKTYIIKSIQVEFDMELGNMSATARITEYKPEQKFAKTTFTCPVKDYKDAEIIDLR